MTATTHCRQDPKADPPSQLKGSGEGIGAERRRHEHGRITKGERARRCPLTRLAPIHLTALGRSTRPDLEEQGAPLRVPRRIVRDQTVTLEVFYSKQGYPTALRRVVVRDDEGKRIVFLTNNTQLAPQVVGELYRLRWQVDLRQFLARLIGTIALALVPVVFTAFVTMPSSPSRHPGEASQPDTTARHMT